MTRQIRSGRRSAPCSKSPTVEKARRPARAARLRKPSGGNPPPRGTRLAFEPLEQRLVLDVSFTPLLTVETNFGSFQIELFRDETPLTVENFLDYVNSGAYEDSFFHRLAEDFVLQGGGFNTTDEVFTSLGQLGEIPTNPPVLNEPGISNLRGTVAMAKLGGDPNSATSQFFINLVDNDGPPAFLDTQNGGFTVFGQVVDMTLIDQFAQFGTENLDPDNFNTPYTDVPLSAADELIVIRSISGDGLLHGTVYNDLDRDGTRDPDEPGLAGVTVFIDANGNGELDDDELWTTTDAEGNYQFQLPPGEHEVRVVLPEGRESSQPQAGDSYTVELGIGRVVGNLDFGSHGSSNPPGLIVSADSEVEQFAVYELLAQIFDADYIDIHEVSIDWGDGGTSQFLVTPANSSHGAAGELTIRIDYSHDVNNFFDTQEKRDAMQAAADTLAALFADQLTAILPDGEANTFDITFTNPADGMPTATANYSVEANELVIFVGGRPFDGPDGGDPEAVSEEFEQLAQGGPGGFQVAGGAEFVSNAQTRGQEGAAEEPPTDFGPWGGAISFNSGIDWYFGLSNSGLGSDRFDFFSVALHELAHVLGIGSAPSWNVLIDGVNHVFTGEQAAAEFGGFPPVTEDGEHFAEGLIHDGREAALDPTLDKGLRKLPNNLDVAAMGDVGWDLGNASTSGGEITAGHVYNATGVFTVLVRVTDSNGNVATHTHQVTVGDPTIGTGDPEVIVVTTLEDVVAIDNQVSLREAILAVNASATVSDAIAGPSTLTIAFDEALFAEGPQTIFLIGSELRIFDHVHIAGPGSDLLTIDAGFMSRVFRVDDGLLTAIDVTIEGVTLTGGRQPDSGGAILNKENLTLIDVRMVGNSQGDLHGVTRGGGLYTFGDVTIINSTISGNSALLGGGIYVDHTAAVEIINSTISGNSANLDGGGLYVRGEVTLVNRTISGNQAAGLGGGFYLGEGSADLMNVTTAFNSAAGGGGIYNSGSVATLTNTIVADNQAAGVLNDLVGTFQGNHNLVRAPGDAVLDGEQNLLGADPLLSPLGDFGGPTQTHYLIGGSPAIDAGTELDAPATDQRGEPRPLDGTGDSLALWDIGAVEVSYPPLIEPEEEETEQGESNGNGEEPPPNGEQEQGEQEQGGEENQPPDPDPPINGPPENGPIENGSEEGGSEENEQEQEEPLTEEATGGNDPPANGNGDPPGEEPPPQEEESEEQPLQPLESSTTDENGSDNGITGFSLFDGPDLDSLLLGAPQESDPQQGSFQTPAGFYATVESFMVPTAEQSFLPDGSGGSGGDTHLLPREGEQVVHRVIAGQGRLPELAAELNRQLGVRVAPDGLAAAIETAMRESGNQAAVAALTAWLETSAEEPLPAALPDALRLSGARDILRAALQNLLPELDAETAEFVADRMLADFSESADPDGGQEPPLPTDELGLLDRAFSEELDWELGAWRFDAGQWPEPAAEPPAAQGETAAQSAAQQPAVAGGESQAEVPQRRILLAVPVADDPVSEIAEDDLLPAINVLRLADSASAAGLPAALAAVWGRRRRQRR